MIADLRSPAPCRIHPGEMKDVSRWSSIAIPLVHGRRWPHPGRVPEHPALRDSRAHVRIGEAFGVRWQSEAAPALSTARNILAHQTLTEPKRCRAPLGLLLTRIFARVGASSGRSAIFIAQRPSGAVKLRRSGMAQLRSGCPRRLGKLCPWPTHVRFAP